MRILTLVLCVMLALTANSQTIEELTTEFAIERKNSFKSSPFENDSFKLGTINTEGITYSVLLRFDQNRREFQYIKSRRYPAKLVSMKDDMVVSLNNKTYKVFVNGFLQVLSTELMSLTHKSFVASREAVTSYHTPTDAAYTSKVTLFIKLNDEIEELPRGKKAIIKFLLQKDSSVKTFVKDNDINVKKTDDLIILLKYIKNN